MNEPRLLTLTAAGLVLLSLATPWCSGQPPLLDAFTNRLTLGFTNRVTLGDRVITLTNLHGRVYENVVLHHATIDGVAYGVAAPSAILEGNIPLDLLNARDAEFLGLATLRASRLAAGWGHLYKGTNYVSEKYGPPVWITNRPPTMVIHKHKFKGYEIWVAYVEGKCLSQNIKPKPKRQMEDSECEALIQEIGFRGEFKKSKTPEFSKWQHPATGVVAGQVYSAGTGLLITVPEWVQHHNAAAEIEAATKR